MTVDELRRFKLIYVATPYSRYPGGLYPAFLGAVQVMARLREAGITNIYSPILHCHPMAVWGGLDPLDYKIWVPMNAAIIAPSDAMLVVMMDGWEVSKGIRDEVDDFLLAAKPIYYLDPKTFDVLPRGNRLSNEAKGANKMSLGEDRVRVKFNPSDNSLVSQIKQKSAELIDLCEQNKVGKFSVFETNEINRDYALAQTYYQIASMLAVKAATA